MSGGLNKVLVIGNVGKDPEIKQTNAGAQVATFSVAVNKSWRDKQSGEKRDHTEWIRVVVFNENLVTVIEKYVHKGSKLYLEGEYKTRKWTDKGGVDHYSTEVVLSAFNSKIVLLDKAEGTGRPAPSEDDYGTTKARQATTTAKEDLDDEIPF